jgi:NAD(P)H-dependent FMN reductase
VRIAAIDASALGGGSVTAALEAAAEATERHGGVVERVRLYSMPTAHGMTGGGIPRSRDFDTTTTAAVQAIVDADGVLLASPATHAAANAGTQALLRRLAATFAGHCLERGYHGRPTRLTPGRRVGLLTSSPSPTALASTGAVSFGVQLRTRRAFGRGGVHLVGHVCVPDLPGHPLARDRAMARAVDLGRELAETLLSEGDVLPRMLERPVPLSRLATP